MMMSPSNDRLQLWLLSASVHLTRALQLADAARAASASAGDVSGVGGASPEWAGVRDAAGCSGVEALHHLGLAAHFRGEPETAARFFSRMLRRGLWGACGGLRAPTPPAHAHA